MTSAGEISGVRDNGRQMPRDPFDWYIEPEWCVVALLAAESFDGQSWDPCAGSGTIPRVMWRNRLPCHATDIVDRCHILGLIEHDFIGQQLALFEGGIHNVVMNPPYRQAEAFIRRALALRDIRKVAALCQAKFLYSVRRHRLFTGHPPARIYHLSTRPSMPPGDLLMAGKIKPTGGKLDFCWIVWEPKPWDKALGTALEPTKTYWIRRP